MDIAKIIGLKVVAIKGMRTDMRRKKGFSPDFILFDDGQTYIELDDQDYYAYHDCDACAKTIQVWQNADRWKAMMEDEKHYPDADKDIGWL
jgi:hypothetical protein